MNPLEPAAFPVLTGLLDGANLQLVDIGGRGSAVAELKALAPCAEYYVSEPDRDEAERLQQTLPRRARWRSVTVMTEAIGSTPPTATLYVTRRPGMSSLLEPDPETCERFYLGHKFRVVDTVTVPMISLDEAAARYGFPEAAFLKVDTQGSELDILRSGPRLLSRSLLAVQVEAEFRPFYKGQPLFADVDSHLRQQGFSLFSLQRTALRRAGYRRTIYSKRTVTWAHCVYFREPEALSADPATRQRHVPWLLALAMAFDAFDLAFAVVDAARDAGLLGGRDLDRLTEEVERCGLARTASLLLEAEQAAREAEPIGEMLLAPSLRDKKQFG